MGEVEIDGINLVPEQPHGIKFCRFLGKSLNCECMFNLFRLIAIALSKNGGLELFQFHMSSMEQIFINVNINVYPRWRKAYKNMHCKRQPKIYNALKKYGYDGFNKVLLEECSSKSLREREAYWK